MYNVSYSIPYIIILFLFFILSLKTFNPNPNIGIQNNSYFKSEYTFRFLMLGIVFLIFFGFRGYIYTDWLTYSVFYDSLPTFFSKKSILHDYLTKSMYVRVGWEKGFIWLSILLKTFSTNYFIWQFYLVGIDFVILYIFFRENLKKDVLLAFIFFFVYSGVVIEFNLVRNSKALLLFLLSYRYLINRKMIPYFVLNILGCFFHTSSIIYLLSYFIFIKKFSIRNILAIYIIGLAIFILKIKWIKIFLTFILSILPDGRILSVLTFYIDSNSYGLTLTFFQKIIEFFIVFYFIRKKVSYNENTVLYNCFFIYHFIYLYFSEIIVFVERFTILFVFSYWLIFPKYYSMISKKVKYLFLIVFFTISVPVIIKSNYKIICKYDNYLFGYKNYNEREMLLEKFFSNE